MLLLGLRPLTPASLVGTARRAPRCMCTWLAACMPLTSTAAARQGSSRARDARPVCNTRNH
jgi:hypothetical protein